MSSQSSNTRDRRRMGKVEDGQRRRVRVTVRACVHKKKVIQRGCGHGKVLTTELFFWCFLAEFKFEVPFLMWFVAR